MTDTLIQTGDRVIATRHVSHGIIPKGTTGTVVRKYTPAHCPGVWSLTVAWDIPGHEHPYLAGYCYPDPVVSKLGVK